MKVTDSALVGEHTILFDIFLRDLDPSSIYKQSVDFQLVFEIQTEEDSWVPFQNTAPQLDSLQTQIFVFAGTESVEVIGLPYDLQLDDFHVAAWGIDSGDQKELVKPDWVSFLNGDISEGLIFKFTPKEEQKDLSFHFKLVLADLNIDDPKSKDYFFDVLVQDNQSDLEQNNFVVDLKTQATPIRPPTALLNVTVEAPDSSGRVMIKFDKVIQVPWNYTQWSDENEGSDRFQLTYYPTYETQTILYDQDLSNSMKWSVIEPIRDDHNLLRRMQSEDSKNLTTYVDKI